MHCILWSELHAVECTACCGVCIQYIHAVLYTMECETSLKKCMLLSYLLYKEAFSIGLLCRMFPHSQLIHWPIQSVCPLYKQGLFSLLDSNQFLLFSTLPSPSTCNQQGKYCFITSFYHKTDIFTSYPGLLQPFPQFPFSSECLLQLQQPPLLYHLSK
jgi:hypothetical protein